MNTKTLVALIGAASATELMTSGDYEFFNFVATYGRSYGTKAEFEFRSTVFKNTLAQIEEHNSTDGQTSTVGINFMSDWTTEEKKKLTGTVVKNSTQENVVILDETATPASVDWRKEGAVTPVKNQGQCGSCWAFSTTGSLEGAMFLKTKSLQSFSEQQLVDCSGSFGNQGCNGGLMDSAFKYIEKNPLMLESEYAYTATQSKCKYDSSKGVGTVKGFKDVSSGSASQLKAAVAQQPVSVAIEADQIAFQGYKTGVITKGCGSQLDHGVLAVGYGTEKGQDYFLVKNSWGPSWGDAGYVKIAPNQCGIANQPSYPTE